MDAVFEVESQAFDPSRAELALGTDWGTLTTIPWPL